MQLEHAKYLYDIQYASGLLADFVQGKAWPDYEANAMLRLMQTDLVDIGHMNSWRWQRIVLWVFSSQKPILCRCLSWSFRLIWTGREKGLAGSSSPVWLTMLVS